MLDGMHTVLFVAFFGSLYFIPAIVARTREVEHFGVIFLVNIFFGWTVLGWFAALIWAVTDKPHLEKPLPVGEEPTYATPRHAEARRATEIAQGIIERAKEREARRIH